MLRFKSSPPCSPRQWDVQVIEHTLKRPLSSENEPWASERVGIGLTRKRTCSGLFSSRSLDPPLLHALDPSGSGNR